MPFITDCIMAAVAAAMCIVFATAAVALPVGNGVAVSLLCFAAAVCACGFILTLNMILIEKSWRF